MKYIVTRTLEDWEDNPRCEGTVKETVVMYGREEKVYTIELNTLEDLHNLMKKVGHPIIVFEKSEYNLDLPMLEIYDGYRE